MKNIKEKLAEILSAIDNQQKALNEKDSITGEYMSNTLYGEVSKTNNHTWLVGEIRKLYDECE